MATRFDTAEVTQCRCAYALVPKSTTLDDPELTLICALLHYTKSEQTMIQSITRKLCYRKDDRAMRPTYGCPVNFRDCLTTPTATIPNIFMVFCSIDSMNVPTKFEVRSFTRS